MAILALLSVVLLTVLIISITFNYYQKRKLNNMSSLHALQNQNIMLAIRAGNIAVWGYDVKQGHLYNIEGEVFPGNNGVSIAEAMAGVHPDDCDEFAKVLQNVVNGKIPDETICIRFKNMHTGEWEYVEKEFAVIKSRSGEVKTVIGTHKDVTKRVLETGKTDELLRKYQHLYNENQTILNSLPMGVSIYDKEGKMFYINQTMCNTLSIKDHNQFLSTGATLWDNPLLGDKVKNKILKGENTIFNYQIDCNKLPVTYFNPSDKTLYVSCISNVVKNEHSEVESYIFIHRDITRQEIQEMEMKDMSETLMHVIDASGYSVWEYSIKERKFYSYRGDICVENGTTYEDTIAKHTPKSAQLCNTVFYNLTHGITEIEHAMFEVVNAESKEIIFYESELIARKDSDHRIVKIYGIQKEVTDEYNYQLELEESKLKTQLAIQISDMVLWEYDVTKRIFHTLNEKWESEVLTTDDYYQVTHPDDLQKVYEIINLMDSRRNETFEFDTRFKFPSDDQWQYIKITGTPLKLDQNDKVVKYTGFQRNNTQWHNLAEKLEDTNKMNNLILNNMKSGLVYLSANREVIWENASEKFPLDFTNGQALFDEVDKPCETCTLEDIWTKRDAHTVEKILDNGNILEIVGNPIIDDKGDLSGIILRIDDISERKRLYGELEKAKNRAEESDKLKSAFLANMSHEIRTPLNSIVGFSELLKNSDNEIEKNEFWNIINTNNELLLRLISDILDLSKIEAGAIELKPVEFDLAERFNDVYSTFKLRNANNKLEFVCENPYNKCMVTLDENRITQIITNFVTNAFKFTPKGQVKMGYEYVNNGIRLYCIDTGIGIASEKMNKIFTRFSKLDDFAQGTGLGTAICKAIVDAYSGKIGANSVIGEGSTFWAWIPCKATIN